MTLHHYGYIYIYIYMRSRTSEGFEYLTMRRVPGVPQHVISKVFSFEYMCLNEGEGGEGGRGVEGR